MISRGRLGCGGKEEEIDGDENVKIFFFFKQKTAYEITR